MRFYNMDTYTRKFFNTNKPVWNRKTGNARMMGIYEARRREADAYRVGPR